MPASRELHGRTVIYADAVEVDSSNIGSIVESAAETHEGNASDIDYLYNYYLGEQPILDREKTYNDEINNKVVENRANEIVSFKTGYLLSAPIQYIDNAANDTEEEIENSNLVQLTRWCAVENKETSDMNIARWQSICGTAFRMSLPYADVIASPFQIVDLDPRNTFVVYSSRIGHKPLVGVTFVTLEDDSNLYYCYTDKEFFVLNDDFELASDGEVKSGSHSLGMIPIIEYPANDARIGDFEIVLPLLDAANTIQSNRVDGVEQFVQSILCLEGMDIMAGNDQTQTEAESSFMGQLREIGGLLLPPGAKAYYLTQELNQAQTQTLKDDIYEAILTICGMPNRNGGSSTSDTGAAVVLRDGWSAAESRARNTEIYFKRSERQFLNLITMIANENGIQLDPADVGIRFPRRNYTNDSSNVTNLVTMLGCDWIRPEFAYEHCNMTPDPHREYLLAKKWHEAQEEETVNDLAQVNAEMSEEEHEADHITENAV